MISIKETTVFNSGCEAIVNTVNCVGVMGAGLALEFRLRYPKMYNQYLDECKNGNVKIGKLNMYMEDSVKIIGFPTKFNWKYSSQISYIEKGLDYFVQHYKEFNIKSIAIPPLGCSNGGLDFETQVKPLIISKLKDVDLEIYICLDPGFAEGIEKIMIDRLMMSDIESLCDELKIKGRTKDALSKEYNKITRFYQLLKIPGVGIETYKKLFNKFYNYKDEPKRYTQQSLF